tara:strand:- start:2281 stop:2757 length:477 start_codon:yes stop_codon:yes gene_type:complete
MSIQQLLSQLSGMGLGDGGFGSQQEDIFGAMHQEYFQSDPEYTGTIEDSPLTEGMFQTISPNLVRSASMGAYSPLFQQSSQNLIPQLLAQLGGQQARKAHGGFAGSGGAMRQQSLAKDVYGKGMQDTLNRAMAGKTQSLGTIQDIINQWQSTAQSFMG